MTGEERFNRLQKPGKRVKQPKPLKQVGKVGKARQDDRAEYLAEHPADHTGRWQCYIGLEMTEQVDVEHIIDASARPDLRHNPLNKALACNSHNVAKKNGTLTAEERKRVAQSIQQVLDDTAV